jgi:hypothetical protein
MGSDSSFVSAGCSVALCSGAAVTSLSSQVYMTVARVVAESLPRQQLSAYP